GRRYLQYYEELKDRPDLCQQVESGAKTIAQARREAGTLTQKLPKKTSLFDGKGAMRFLGKVKDVASKHIEHDEEESTIHCSACDQGMTTNPDPMHMYTEGKDISLYNMCCIDGAKQHVADGSIDLIIGDPPFGIGEEKFTTYYNRSEEHILPGYVPAPKDYYRFSKDWIMQAYRVLKEDGSMYVMSVIPAEPPSPVITG